MLHSKTEEVYVWMAIYIHILNWLLTSSNRSKNKNEILDIEKKNLSDA